MSVIKAMYEDATTKVEWERKQYFQCSSSCWRLSVLGLESRLPSVRKFTDSP